MVLLNTAAAFMAAGLDEDFQSGIKRAVESIDTGRAREKLHALVQFTQQCDGFTRS
jgi:anthranilate phosphoribosyltransferase